MLTFFWSVVLFFFLFRALSAFMGDHETGDGGGEIHDTGSHETNAEGEHGTVMFSSFFTLRNFLHFGIGFGAVGVLAVNLGYGPVPACGFAILGGFVLAFLGALFFGAIYRQQGNTVASLDLLVGKPGRVITAIPSGGVGQIETLNQFGTTITVSAQSQDGAITLGSRVEIISVVANALIVRAAD
jgi:membrane protein implicated in regulation of membrane protease activity